MQEQISQPYLFPELEKERRAESALEVSRERDAKAALRGLYALRNKLEGNIFVPHITRTIAEIRALHNVDESKFRERIMFAIEQQMAWTLTEIVEETKLDREFVKEALDQMEKDGLVTFPPRYVPGSDRQYYMVKSTRLEYGEMDDIHKEKPKAEDYLV